MIPLNEHWKTQAACKNTDINLWYTTDRVKQKQSVAMCRTCVVRQECLEYAVAHGDDFGIWGAMIGNQRKKRRQYQIL